jgi:NADPH-dependent 2,4-dienoyl-CoA reductase/sulfur reductase-like enzyme
LRKPADMDGLGLDLRLGVPAAGLDLDRREVVLADGSSVPFDGLVIATGSRPRRLPGQHEVPTVHELRTLDDALALRDVIADGTARLVVIGAGFIGLEVAATARVRGCTVTVLEEAPAPLIRGLGVEMGLAATGVHAVEGVNIRCGVHVESFGVDGVRLAGGELVAADVIVVGVGVSPATEWLDGSGLELRDGVVCDATLATAAPGVYAAGDVARWPNELYGEEMRVEHRTNASEQGVAAARNLLIASAGGTGEVYAPVPFFWSDQAKHRIQFLGRSATADDDTVRVVVGSPDDHKFLTLYGRRGRLWGVLGVNVVRLVMPYRALLADAASWDDALALADAQRQAQPS